MRKTIRVNYTEQSRAVVADTTIQYDFDSADGLATWKTPEEVELEAFKLFEKAQARAALKTMQTKH